MSATVEINNVAWRKRRRQEEETELEKEMKKPKYYHYRLASESSKNSEEDTESVYSLQGRETDVVRDTTDTDSGSESNADEYELIEYEVASLSESENGIIGNSTSDSEDQVIFAAAIGAMCDSSLETWITDCEDSDNSSMDDSVVIRLGFTTCVLCKSENDNPLYRYCEKCFQDRKKFYPPRPRGNKKSKRKLTEPPVKLDILRSCLSGLSSQDSGVGSSQECPPLDLDQIVVPHNLKSGTCDISPIPDILHKEDVTKETQRELRRKRQASESSLSDFDNKKRKFSRYSSSRKDVPENLVILSQSSMSTSRDSREGHVPVTRTSKNISSQDPSNSSSHTSTDEKSLSSSQSSTITTLSLSQRSTETSITSSQTSEKSVTLRSYDNITKKSKPLSLSQNSDGCSDVGTNTSFASSSTNSESTELCIMCNSAPKDSIFLHTNIGHQCCCYKCAKRTLHTIKRCPICNRSVNKVVRIFQA